MKHMKRVVAGLLCASILLNMNGVTAYAQVKDADTTITEDVEENDTLHTNVTDTVPGEDIPTEQVTTTEEESQDAVLVSDAETVTTEAVTESTTEAATETTTEQETTQEECFNEDFFETGTTEMEENTDVSKEAPLVNWLVVAEDYITDTTSQHILVDIGNENSGITDATLTYKNVTTNTVYNQQVTKQEETLLTFEIDRNTIKENGEYEVTGMTVWVAEESYDIDFSAIGIHAKFGVNVTVETNPDVYLTEDADVDTDGIIVTDAKGNQIDAADIGEAVSQVSDEGLLQRSKNGDLIVVLDPGHGGSDSGACANGVVEKVANLKIAQSCKAQLETYDDVTVYMTRNSDIYVGLEDRTAYAASVGADIFVSLHNNAAGSAAMGTEVYYPNASYNGTAHSVGQGLSQEILDALTNLGLVNRGIRTRDYSPAGGASQTVAYPDGSVADYYSVIRTSKMYGFPGIIVEHGFLTNPSDAANFLSSDASLKALGVADAEAIASYFDLGKIKGTTYKGVDYKDVYNYKYYVNKYPSLKEKYGNDKVAVFRHFLKVGMNKGYQACADFNVKYYRNRYVHLRKQYGMDYKRYYLHYIKKGKSKGYDGKTKCKTPEDGIQHVTYYKGVDYSAVYNYDYYVKKYPNVLKTVGDDEYKVIAHFVTKGMPLGRRGSKDFVVTYYKNRYEELRKAYGNDLTKYYMHYIQTGKDEGMDGKTSCKKQIGKISNVTIYNGVDYSAVYDYKYYLKKYPSVKKNIGKDENKVLKNFVTKGMKAGRQGNKEFVVKYYKNRYADLREKYGDNLKKYYLHYIKKGKDAGLDGKTECTKPKKTTTKSAAGSETVEVSTVDASANKKKFVTVYKGVDYKAVYNYYYYIERYPGVVDECGKNKRKVLEHFVTKGMKRGRQGCANFNVKYYKNRYSDLRVLYRNDLKQYYMHYIQYGKKEGRDGKTKCLTIQNPVTRLNGVEYKYVYNFAYYQKKYKGVKKKFGDDDVATLEYFIKVGMKKGHQAKKSFDVTSYRYANADLRKLYRSDLKQYYMHYIKYGRKEKRKTTGVTKLQNPWTVYNGVDYSKKYDFWKFRKKYKPVADLYGMDDYGQLEYYVNRISGMTVIAGPSTTNVDQMVRYFKANATYPSYYANSDAPTLRKFCKIVYDESVAEGIDPAVTFCQAMKETGFLRFGGDVSITQYNFAGLGATGGVPGNSFSTVRQGIRAQVQHLKAYACSASLNKGCVDSRFSYVSRGTAPFVEWLGIHENPYGKGWATAYRYGYSMKNDYIIKLYRY